MQYRINPVPGSDWGVVMAGSVGRRGQSGVLRVAVWDYVLMKCFSSCLLQSQGSVLHKNLAAKGQLLR